MSVRCILSSILFSTLLTHGFTEESSSINLEESRASIEAKFVNKGICSSESNDSLISAPKETTHYYPLWKLLQIQNNFALLERQSSRSMKSTGEVQLKNTDSFFVRVETSDSPQETTSLLAAEEEQKPIDQPFSSPIEKTSSYSKVQPTLEIKGGYFFFADSKMRDIYDEGGGDVQLCGSYPIWRWLQVYGSVEYLERHGHSLNGHQKTSIWEVPLSLGLKPVFTIVSGVQYYFTLGPRYFFVHQHNHSQYVDRNISKNGLGGFVNTGFNFIAWRHLLIDVFGEYSYKRMSFHSSKKNVHGRSVQVGGFTFGAGLGYAF